MLFLSLCSWSVPGLLISIPVFLHSLLSLSQSNSPNSCFPCAAGAELWTCCTPGSTQGLPGSQCYIPNFALLQDLAVPWKGSKSPMVSHLWPKCPCTVTRDPAQAFSGGTPPCHLVGLCSCTAWPQVSKQFMSSKQVCLVIPRWEGCESTANNHLHLLSGAEAVPGAPCPSERSAWHKESLISTWGRAHLCRVTAGQI